MVAGGKTRGNPSAVADRGVLSPRGRYSPEPRRSAAAEASRLLIPSRPVPIWCQKIPRAGRLVCSPRGHLRLDSFALSPHLSAMLLRSVRLARTASSNHVCPALRRSRQPGRAGFTRSSTTDFGFWRSKLPARPPCPPARSGCSPGAGWIGLAAIRRSQARSRGSLAAPV
jgi:hypothetical protein